MLQATPGRSVTAQPCRGDEMRRAMAALCLLGLLGLAPLYAQEAVPTTAALAAEDAPLVPAPAAEALPSEAPCPPEAPHWQSPWGFAALRIIPAGPKTAPNGLEYHPNFSMDLDLNAWIWRSQRLYAFGDLRYWGEKGEFGVTNGNDGVFATSKRQFDVTGGAAWNYAGRWEARAFGYSDSNLNRGTSPVTPDGFTDGGVFENRYYLSAEYDKLGEPGFDVARAPFLSAGYYLTKNMVGNDGQVFKPGLLLRAYLTYDIGDWPCYAFADATFIGGNHGIQPKLLLFDVGAAARPFSACPQCEFRLGVDNTADIQVGNVQNLWYLSFRYIF